MLPVTTKDIPRIRDEISKTREQTKKPFGVNLIISFPIEEKLDACLDEGVKIISFFWGNPAPFIDKVHDAGGLVMHTVGTATEALEAKQAGVDIIVAQGWEAGGHVWGTVASLPLVPRVVDAVDPTPVVAAGGISDGRGLAAALMLGASGVWVGTRFLASREASVHPFYLKRLLKANEADTIYTELFDIGWARAPHRAMKNSTYSRWEEAGRPESGRRPGEGRTVAARDGKPVPLYSSQAPTTSTEGDIEAMCLYAGQGAGLVREVLPADEILKELVDEAVRVMKNRSRLVINGSKKSP